MTPELLRRIIEPIKNKIYNIVGRAVLTALDNSGKTLKAQVQMFGAETFGGIDVFQNYGFESLPDTADNDNEVVLTSIGGNRVMSVITAIHNREHRPKDLAAGEAKVYTKYGQHIHLKADGSIVCTESGGAVLTMKGGEFTLLGKVYLKDAGGQPVMLETIIDKLNNHGHLYAPGPGAPVLTGTMTAGGTTLIAGTDSAADVKAKP